MLAPYLVDWPNKSCIGRIERFFLDSLKEYSDITVERGVLPESITLDEVDANDREAYPITVKLQHLTEEEAIPAESKVHSNGSDIQNGLFRSNLAKDDTEDIINAAKKNPRAGSLETVKAKYVIGCDGAHSWVRRQLGFAMEGEQTDYIWFDNQLIQKVKSNQGIGVSWTLFPLPIFVSKVILFFHHLLTY